MQLLTSHASAEWYTPPYIIDLVREALGEIDLDPASAEFPQTWIRATEWWTAADQPLAKESWLLTAPEAGAHYSYAPRVFMNPPYGKHAGKSQMERWSRKLVAQYELGYVHSAVMLVNSTHGYKWYEELWSRHPCCLARERISFLQPDNTTTGPAKRGQTFVYLGPGVEKFTRVFQNIGRVILPGGRVFECTNP